MKTLKTFRCTLYPAYRSFGAICWTMDVFGGTYPREEFHALSTESAITLAEAFATQHGKACYISLQCLSKPKPPRFDALTKGLFANLDKAEVLA
jgi:hypothetical protein